MTFLFPLYLLGAAAIAIPILLHLRKRPPRDHVAFSSLMFLEKTPERLTRRTRIERWLLLALRCLALALLALMFGRPFLRTGELVADTGHAARILVLLDSSASMRRGDLWTQAASEAAEALRATGPGDETAVARFDETLEMLLDFPAMADLGGPARARLLEEALATGPPLPGWRASRLGEALAAAADLLGDAASRREVSRQEIVLISDFAEGASYGALSRHAWPDDVTARPVAVALERDPGNLAVHLVAPAAHSGEEVDEAGEEAADESEAAAAAGSPGAIREARRRVRITSTRESESERFTLAWQDAPETRVEGLLPAGASRVLPVPSRPDDTRDGILEIRGDSHVYDNLVHVARIQPRPVDILYLGQRANPDDVGSPLFYLSRAMRRTPAIHPAVEAWTYDRLSEDPARLARADVVVARADSTTPESAALALARHAGQGGTVIAVASEGSSPAFLSGLLGIPGLELREAEVKDYSMLADIDFSHPALAPFAQARIRDFSKIHTWRHRELVLPAAPEAGEAPDSPAGRLRVLARFDGSGPAWVEMPPAGGEGGKIYLFLSGWEPRESQLALSSKFIPLIYGLLGHAGYSAAAEPARYVGDPLPLPAEASGVKVTLPGGSTLAPDPGASRFAGTEEPGFYLVASRDAEGQEQTRTYAVNVPPQESRVDPVDPAIALGELGVRLDPESAGVPAAMDPAAAEARQRRMEAEERESRQKLWQWILAAVLVVLLAETWLAGRRRAAPAAEPAPAAG